MIAIFGVQPWIIYFKSISEFRDNASILRDLYPKQILRKTNFKLPLGNIINNGTTMETKSLQRKDYENRSNCSKITAEHLFKKKNIVELNKLSFVEVD